MSSSYEKVGRTAFVIAQWRREETEAADPLFSDHVANIFLDEEAVQWADGIAKASPSTRFLVRYRTRHFDDTIRERIRAGIRQFVILGSGLDTRPIRLASDGVTFYEVEQEHVVDYKRSQLAKHGYAEASRFVAADYTAVDYLSALEASGFDPREPTFLLWEGNVFYLRHDNACAVLTGLRERLARFEITFDYLSAKLIGRTTGYQKSGALLDGFRSLGAPWSTGFADIGKFADDVGLTVQDDFLIADYVNRTSREIQVDRTLFDDYSIATFAKA